MTIHVSAEVRYWEDATINGIEDTNGDLIPCRKGEHWCPIINIETGIILNWEHGKKADIHYKVCDCFDYVIHDNNGFLIREQFGGYVPRFMCPKENGFGDYIIMEINSTGLIHDWDKVGIE